MRFPHDCSRKSRFSIAIAAPLILILTIAGPAMGQEGSDRDFSQKAKGWKLETARLRNGKELHGLWQQDRESEVEFLEVARPPGKPMYLLLHAFPASDIVEKGHLPEPERLQLAQRVHEFRHRVAIEAGRMDALSLQSVDRQWKYAGPWFSLVSTADEESTRRVVVRVEQVFRAYRNLLPPKTKAKTQLTVELFGTSDEYQQRLFRRGVTIANPAYYSASENTIMAGTDLTVYTEQLGRARSENLKVRTRYEAMHREIPIRLARLAAELAANGIAGESLRDEIAAQRRVWEEECQRGLTEVAEAERRNDAKFDQASAQMFARLYHEAFHAYLENFVYPHESHRVPRWLNEGLAQIFESAQFDLDALRIDAPAPLPLAALKADLRQQNPLRIADIIVADDRQFLAGHIRGESPHRLYAHSWGLAYFAVFELRLLDSGRLDQFVELADNGRTPLGRFEHFTQSKIPDLENRWRLFILASGAR